MRAIWKKILDTPWILYNAFTNPLRVRNICWRILQGIVSIVVAAIVMALMIGDVESPVELLNAILLSMICGILADFILFEYVLEPLKLGGGFYWEGGPYPGEGNPDDPGYWPE